MFCVQENKTHESSLRNIGNLPRPVSAKEAKYFCFVFCCFKMATLDSLPTEVVEKILWKLRHDPVALHRVEAVCSKWADIVRFFERHRGLQFRHKKALYFLLDVVLLILLRIGRAHV